MSEAIAQYHDKSEPVQMEGDATASSLLEASDAILRNFYDSAPMMMGVVEVLESDIIHLSDNAATERFMGVPPKATQGRRAGELGIPARHIQEWIGHYHAAQFNNAPVRFEYEHLTESGSRWMSATVSFIGLSPAGNPRCSYIVEDITRRKQAQLHQEFISRLDEKIRVISDPDDILWAAAHAAGQYLRVSRAHFNEIDVESNRISVHRNYTHGTFSSEGDYALSSFGSPEFLAGFHEGQVMAVSDVTADERTAPAYDAAYRPLNVRAFIAVPCMRGGKWVAAFIIDSSSPRSWTPEEIALIETIAQRTWLAVENARLYLAAQQEIEERKRAEAALKASQEHYRILTEVIPQLVWTTRPDGVLDYVNEQWIRYTGCSLDESRVKGWDYFLPPADADQAANAWMASVETGKPYAVEYRLRGADGIFRWFLARGIARKDEQGRIIQWLGTCTDIDAQKRATEKARFLAESSAALASSLDYETTLSTVANMAVPHLADWCAVHIVETDGKVRQLAVAHRDPARVQWAQALQSRYPYNADSPRGVPNVLRTGQSEYYPEISDEMLVASALDEEHLRIMREIGFKSVMIVPMTARGKTLGAITFVSAESGRPYTLTDVSAAEDLAAGAALAVDNARLFQAERERSDQLALAISEVHHRVKNNLQSVAALLEMQIPERGDLVSLEAVRDSLSQIKTIALVHDLLARDQPIGKVNVGLVLTNLVALLNEGMKTEERPAPISISVEPVWIPTKAATSVALIVNELISNAAKHNRKRYNGEKLSHDAIVIRLTQTGSDIQVTVQDTGPGFPPGFDPQRDANIGLELVLTLVRHDLHGTVTFSNGSSAETAAPVGGQVKIVFTEDLPSE